MRLTSGSDCSLECIICVGNVGRSRHIKDIDVPINLSGIGLAMTVTLVASKDEELSI